jgi:PAS domain S-box-containing protein
MALTALVFEIPGWPKPYSWQYLGISQAVAIACGIGPGLVALVASTLAVLWLGVPTPVHPGVEMFVVIDGCLLGLLYRWKRAQSRAERVLRERQATIERYGTFLHTVIDRSPALITVRDGDGRCLLANAAAARFHGTTVQGLEGANAADLQTMPADMLGQDREVLRTGREMITDSVDVAGADGVLCSFLNVKTPLPNADGMFDRVLTTSVDITWRKRAEARVREANATLAESDRRKNDFIAVLSHELRNPLAPIRFAVPLLRRERLTAAGARAVDVIDRQVTNLTRLVDDLLDVSRITRGKIELRREDVTVASIIAAATEAASPGIAAAGHALRVDVTGEPLRVHADAPRIAQVVTNLLDNSAKYTPRGGEIVVRVAREDGEAVVRVRDNGVGIPPDALGGVFDMFRQIRSTQATPGDEAAVRLETLQGGLGIGLALAKELVQMHGGSIEAHSAGIGRGAEFVVRLPLAQVAVT